MGKANILLQKVNYPKKTNNDNKFKLVSISSIRCTVIHSDNLSRLDIANIISRLMII